MRHIPCVSVIVCNVCPAMVNVTRLPASVFPEKVGSLLLVNLSPKMPLSECSSKQTKRLSNRVSTVNLPLTVTGLSTPFDAISVYS